MWASPLFLHCEINNLHYPCSTKSILTFFTSLCFFFFFFPIIPWSRTLLRPSSCLISLFPSNPAKALEERLKQEQREEVHALKEAHRRTLDILRQQSEQELQTLRFELEDEGKAKLGKALISYQKQKREYPCHWFQLHQCLVWTAGAIL